MNKSDLLGAVRAVLDDAEEQSGTTQAAMDAIADLRAECNRLEEE